MLLQYRNQMSVLRCWIVWWCVIFIVLVTIISKIICLYRFIVTFNNSYILKHMVHLFKPNIMRSHVHAFAQSNTHRPDQWTLLRCHAVCPSACVLSYLFSSFSEIKYLLQHNNIWHKMRNFCSNFTLDSKNRLVV